jgi:thiamine biosynthesis lipoprotein ApbE
VSLLQELAKLDEDQEQEQKDNLERVFQEVKKYGVTMEQLRALDKINRAKLSPLDLDLEIKKINDSKSRRH